MGQENNCLICNTENAQYNDDFLAKRAYFSAPKLKELRLKWNEAIIKIHPVLEEFVTNVNTYKVCDLHFKESDIKKSVSDKSTSNNAYKLPVCNWVLKINALPLSTEELENEKSQDLNTNKKSKENLKVGINEYHVNKNVEMELQSENNNKTKKSFPVKRIEAEKEQNSCHPIKSDYHKKVDVKFSPYPSVKSDNKEVNSKGTQMLQLKSVKNQVLVVTSGSKVVPISNSVLPVSLKNSVHPPKFISIRKLSSIQQNLPTNAISFTKVSSVPKIPIVSKSSSVTSMSSIGEVVKEPIIDSINRVIPTTLTSRPKMKPTINLSVKVDPPIPVNFFSSTHKRKELESYSKDKLLSDLEQNPLPSGWAYKSEEDIILFTQYCILRRFPIFLSVDRDMTTMISVGHEAVNFIPFKIQLKSFTDVSRGLRKLESLKWCLGIGFDNNNHSDLCLILSKILNSRCKMCSKIRHNAQRRESLEIKLRNQPKDLKISVRNLKRINGQLEAKVCKLKLMVTHLKNKQCVECLHDRFVQKNLIQTESESLAAKTD